MRKEGSVVIDFKYKKRKQNSPQVVHFVAILKKYRNNFLILTTNNKRLRKCRGTIFPIQSVNFVPNN